MQLDRMTSYFGEMPVSAGNRSLRREGAALALARGRTISETSAETGVSERTLYAWRQEAEFKVLVQKFRHDLFDSVAGKLSSFAGKAADALESLLSCGVESCRLGAAKAVLESALRLREVLDIEERVVALENAAHEQKRKS
jgi:transposase-like protein